MTVRHNSRRVANDPEALAALLPDELRRFKPSTDPRDFRAHLAGVADWLNTQVPGVAEDLALPVMIAAGLSVANWYRQALGADK